MKDVETEKVTKSCCVEASQPLFRGHFYHMSPHAFIGSTHTFSLLSKFPAPPWASQQPHACCHGVIVAYCFYGDSKRAEAMFVGAHLQPVKTISSLQTLARLSNAMSSSTLITFKSVHAERGEPTHSKSHKVIFLRGVGKENRSTWLVVRLVWWQGGV